MLYITKGNLKFYTQLEQRNELGILENLRLHVVFPCTNLNINKMYNLMIIRLINT